MSAIIHVWPSLTDISMMFLFSIIDFALSNHKLCSGTEIVIDIYHPFIEQFTVIFCISICQLILLLKTFSVLQLLSQTSPTLSEIALFPAAYFEHISILIRDVMTSSLAIDMINFVLNLLKTSATLISLNLVLLVS